MDFKHMLAKKFRLPIGKTSFSGSKSLKGDYFVFKRATSGNPLSRFGVILSGRVVKGAVQRNKIKRTIFNFISKKKLQLTPGRDFLLIAQPPLAAADKNNIEKELGKFLTG